MRGSVLAVVLLAAGCRKASAPSAEPLAPASTRAAPSAAARIPADRTAAGPTAARPVAGEEFFKRFMDAMERQVEADARAGATKKFLSRQEARQFLVSLTPTGFRPRREFFAGLVPDGGDPSALAQRMAAYAQAHPGEVQRRLRALSARLTPLFAQVSNNIQKQFPSRWLTDARQALHKAKAKKRATLLVFCADWAGACKQLKKSLNDPSVQKVLDARFVAARVDLTNPDAPSAKSAQKTYGVSGVPELIVFDKTGHEVARKTDALDVHDLLALLARAK